MSLFGSLVSSAVSHAVSAAVNKAQSTANKGSSSSSNKGSSSSGGSSGGSSVSSSYYDPNKDYSLAIKQAQQSGASQSVISQLQTERQNKVNAQYGGVDPYKGSSNIMGSSNSGSSGGTAGGLYGVPVIGKAENQDGAAVRDRPDLSRRQDLAGGYAISGGYTVFYDQDGYATKAVKGHTDYIPHTDPYAGSGYTNKLWTDQEMLTSADQSKINALRDQANAGKITWDQANQQANAIRSGYGYTIDKTGAVTDLRAQASVDARRQQLGLPTQTLTPGQQSQLQALGINTQTTQYPQSGQTGSVGQVGQADVGGYSSFDDFLDGMGYDSYSQQAQAAIQAAVQAAINNYNSQIQQTDQQSDELARQAYIAKMLGQKNLDQKLAASGYAGGMADSQRIATETSYQEQLNDIEMQRQNTVQSLQDAITQAQLSGDQQLASELSSYLQQMQSQWASYQQNQQQLAYDNYWNQQQMNNDNYWNQQQMDNTNYWNQQNLDSQNQDTSYSRAMLMLQAGTMPDEATLSAAGLSTTEATALRSYYLRQMEGTGTTGTEKTQKKNTSKVAQTPAEQGTGGIDADTFRTNQIALSSALSAGSMTRAQTLYDQLWEQANEMQRAQLNKLVSSYGLN